MCKVVPKLPVASSGFTGTGTHGRARVYLIRLQRRCGRLGGWAVQTGWWDELMSNRPLCALPVDARGQRSACFFFVVDVVDQRALATQTYFARGRVTGSVKPYNDQLISAS